MGEHTQSSDGRIASTYDFTIDSFSACFSNVAEERCVSIALGCVSALLLLLSSVVLITYQRCRTRAEDPGDSSRWLYCFLGHLCSTVGAVLSKQLHILVVMGAFAAALDGVIYISFFPVCFRSEKERRRQAMMMRRGRRRQQLLCVCVVMVLTGFLNFGLDHIPSERPFRDRRLLQIPMQDKTEILGYALGVLSFVIACTSKFPSLNRAFFRGEAMTRVGVFSRVLWSLSSALFASAILLYNTGFAFVLRVLPWLMSAICAATLDLVILVIHWCRGSTKETPEGFFPDTENLLEDWGASSRRQRKPQVGLPINIKKKRVQKKFAMGDYMDVTVQPSRKEVGARGLTTEERALNRKVKVIKLQGFCSSDSSCDSEDLQWDFEDPASQSRDTTSKQRERNEFPLQEWTSSRNPLNTCTCATSGPVQKPVPDQENSSGCVVSLDK